MDYVVGCRLMVTIPSMPLQLYYSRKVLSDGHEMMTSYVIIECSQFAARDLFTFFSSDCLPFPILPSIVSWSTVDDHFLYFKSAFIPSKIIGSYLYIHVQSIVQIVIDIISTYTFSKMSFNSFVLLQWEEFV